jgi:hypothetical protein
MSERCYVYAITASDAHLPEGVSSFGGPLCILPYGELGAVVSCIGTADVDGIEPAPTAENLLRHERVVEAVCAGRALPVRFGTILPTPEAVAQAVAAQYHTLLADLDRIGDKIEMGIAALWQEKVPFPLGEHNPETSGRSSPDMASADRHRGLAYLHSRQAEYRQTEAAREKAHTLARDLDAELRPFVLDCRRSLCPSARLALRDRYLVEHKRASAFQKAFDEVRQRHSEVQLLLSGPWPPYSFVAPPARHNPERQSCTQLHMNS